MTEVSIDALLGLSGDDDVILEGLGKKFKANPFTPAQKSVVKKFASKKTHDAFRDSLLTPPQRYALTQAGNMVPATRDLLKQGKGKFIQLEKYFRKQLSASQDLSNVSDVKMVGIRNIDKSVLSANNTVVVDRIKISYAVHASSLEPGLQRYTNAMDAETPAGLAVDIVFLNSEIEIKTATGKILYSGTVKRFFRDSLSSSVGVEGGDDSVAIDPKFVNPNEVVEVTIRYANLLAGTADVINATYKHFIEVKYFGSEIVSK